MQPYLFPYVGYFQLIAAVDQFVIYDIIKYTKKGWINRNRLLRDGEPFVFTLPIEKGSDALTISERRISPSFEPTKLCNQIAQAYRRAPEFGETMPLVDAVLHQTASNLFEHLRHALKQTCSHLEIATSIRTASEVENVTGLCKQDRVLHICERLGATTYINPIGGTTLYDTAAFAERGVDLRFLRPRSFTYPQFGHPFVPWLSIIDVLMFNPRSSLHALLKEGYDLIERESLA
jgi:hypothetical protein